MYWLVAATTDGKSPNDKNKGLIIVPPAIPKIPDKILEIRHIITTLAIKLG